MPSIASRIHDRRLALNLSQEELAALLGCQRAQVSQWETGHRQPAADALVLLARALRCSTDYLLGVSDQEPPAPPPPAPVGAAGASLDTFLRQSEAAGITFATYLGRSYRLRREGWEPV